MMFVKTLTLTLILISTCIVNHVAVSSAFVSNTCTLTYNVSTKTRRSRMKQNTNYNNYCYSNYSNNILFASSKSTPPPSSTTSTSTNNNNAYEKNNNNEHNNNNHLDSSTFIHCDDSNIPPSLQKIISSIHSIKSGSDIRGTFVDHSRVGSVLNVSTAISTTTSSSTLRAITPFAAYCYGAAFAKMVQIRSGKGSAVLSSSSSSSMSSSSLDTTMTTSTTTTTTATTTPMAKFIINTANNLFPTSDVIISSSSSSSPLLELETTNICIGRDPRQSGIRLADAFCRGVESIQGVKVYYTDLASTPSMFAFCRSHSLDCDGGVMVSIIIIT